MSTVDLQKELQHLKESSSLSGPSTSQMTSKGAIASSTPIRIGNAGDSSSPAGSVVNVMASSGPATGSQIQHHSLHQSISSSYVGSTANQSIGGATGTPPNSAGGKQTSAEEKIIRRTSMQVLLPKRPSTDSLSNSPGPSSPGIANWGDSSSKFDGNTTDKISSDTTKLNRKESYKAQRKNYRREKKRVASELLNSLQDPAVIVLADWLKVRGTLKSWTKLWCVLKPGLLLLYKSPKTKSSHWVGTILLTSCQVIERPSKKDGFCFKLFHPLEQSIWAPRGPDKETIGAVVQPLPTAYLIFRAPSQAAGKCWMDALELSLRCSALLLRSNSNSGTSAAADTNATGQISHETQWSEADYEKHFNDQGLDRSDRLAQVQALLDKYHQQYASNNHLTVDDAARRSTSSLSLAPSTTPLFQPLYFAKINWERMLANTPDFHKIKKMRRLHRRSSKDCDEMSDVSTGIEFFTDRRRKLKKSASMHSLGRTDQTSDDEETPRRLSTPGVLPKFVSDLDVDSQNEGAAARTSGAESDSESDNDVDDVDELTETPYVHYPEEEFGAVGEQVEELPEEQKSLLWFLVKQVRPGMDLSKVVLPTFILEPRSFLDKLSDSYYHADILSEAVLEDDPFTRMKKVVRWYMSGFYKKPKGLKKPYNPIIGETFRCFWEHPNGSRTYYIAEQVSHHPPVSAFYVTNRQDGFAISCSILARSKFYGNSTSAVLEGVASLTLLPRGECYTMTTPYANCKGILMGTLSMELGGKVTIECENTGYKADIEFKLKPFLGGSDQINLIQGKIKMGKETLATLSGHWDSEILIKDSRTSEESVLFSSTPETKQKRLKRYCVPLDAQESMESERLWQLVSAAIRRDDQVAATEEKTALEDMQRNAAKERKVMFTEWIPVYFEQDMLTGQWIYKHADLRPWDPRNDLKQYESQFHVLTKTRHKAPAIRTGSIVSSDQLNVMRADSRQSLSALKAPIRTAILSSASLSQMSHLNAPTDSSQEEEFIKRNISTKSIKRIIVSVDEISKILEQHTRQLNKIQTMMERTQYAPVHQRNNTMLSRTIGQDTVIKGLLFALLGISISVIIKFIFK